LGCGVDRIEADSDFALKVATGCVQRQAQPLVRFLVLGTVVIMPGTFRVRPVGLESVGPAVDEEMEVIRHHGVGCFETNIQNSVLPEVKWSVSLLHIGSEMVRVFCQVGIEGKAHAHDSSDRGYTAPALAHSPRGSHAFRSWSSKLHQPKVLVQESVASVASARARTM